VSPQFRWDNYGEVDIDSAELQLTIKPTDKSFFILHASYANTYGFKANRYTDFTGDTANCPPGPPINAISCSDEPMDINTPLLTTGILVSHQFENGLSASSQYNFHEAYRTGGDGDVLNTPFETLDIKLTKEWSINDNLVKASLTVKNIADEYYEDFENDNLVGREAYFQLETTLF
jgi:outer membrane receptor protein involved in Fe transport